MHFLLLLSATACRPDSGLTPDTCLIALCAYLQICAVPWHPCRVLGTPQEGRRQGQALPSCPGECGSTWYKVLGIDIVSSRCCPWVVPVTNHTGRGLLTLSTELCMAQVLWSWWPPY